METGKDATNVALVLTERALLAEPYPSPVQVSLLVHVLRDRICGYIYRAPLSPIGISDK